VRGSDELNFLLYHNPSGLFAVVDAGPKVAAAVGKSVVGQKVRHCDPNRNALPGAAAATAQAIGPAQMLADAKFKMPYFKALGPLSKERWLARLDGPAPAVKTVTVGGATYALLSVCKPHDCAANNMVALYSADRQVVFGKVFQRGRATLIGAPPALIAAELEKLWRSEWRRKG